MQNKIRKPDLLFETSWEVCNKIGGIYTVLSTKANILVEEYGNNLIFIGPDFGEVSSSNPEFEELPANHSLQDVCCRLQLPLGIKARAGRWIIPGKPLVILVDFNGVYPDLNSIFGRMWEEYKVNSLHAYGDYREGCAFGVAAAYVINAVAKAYYQDRQNVVAHFDEWTTGMGLLQLRSIAPEIASIFTTHATSIGRSICGNGKPLYDYLKGYNGDQMAYELNMEAKHSLEKTTAWKADCFTTVSDVTATECRQLLDLAPQVVTPNGFEQSFIPKTTTYRNLRQSGRKAILNLASTLYNKTFDTRNTFIIATSGRNEFRNKGLDMFLDSLDKLNDLIIEDKEIVACIFVPGWTSGINMNTDELFFTSHRLHNEDSDLLFAKTREITHKLGKRSNVSVILIPCYLDGNDGILNINYYDMLPALDATVFASYYEPWGYTPLESIAFHVPTITTDKSGFGLWALEQGRGTMMQGGVEVIHRTDSNYKNAIDEIASALYNLISLPTSKIATIRKKAAATANIADWKTFIKRYQESFEVALCRKCSRLNNKFCK